MGHGLWAVAHGPRPAQRPLDDPYTERTPNNNKFDVMILFTLLKKYIGTSGVCVRALSD